MTNEQFNDVFEYMFSKVDVNYGLSNEKMLHLIWRIVQNYLCTDPIKSPEMLMNLLSTMYKEFSSEKGINYKKSLKETSKEILIVKASEYQAGEDRLHNFNHGAKMTGVEPRIICMFFLLKHLICIDDIISNRTQLTQEQIKEKFIDAINYTILLKANEVQKTNEEVSI